MRLRFRTKAISTNTIPTSSIELMRTTRWLLTQRITHKHAPDCFIQNHKSCRSSALMIGRNFLYRLRIPLRQSGKAQSQPFQLGAPDDLWREGGLRSRDARWGCFSATDADASRLCLTIGSNDSLGERNSTSPGGLAQKSGRILRPFRDAEGGHRAISAENWPGCLGKPPGSPLFLRNASLHFQRRRSPGSSTTED